ncbi:Calmodulin [Thelohanellus kitauei]|uniref:Calmodulin n=1 Tax=Thelohanellus kitauei TaxID=669202 RepID=A0A0C2NA20_THEKT|nr:Calmodulin [Thelohanellus kitauei]
MAQRLSDEQEKDIRDAFDVFDKDGDGQIRSKDLGVVMRCLGMNPTEAELHDMINSMDSNGLGSLTYEQFRSVATQKLLSRDTENEIKEALRIFDKKGTGFVNSTELRHCLTTLGEKLSEEEADEVFRCLDPENNGNINIERATRELCGYR